MKHMLIVMISIITIFFLVACGNINNVNKIKTNTGKPNTVDEIIKQAEESGAKSITVPGRTTKPTMTPEPAIVSSYPAETESTNGNNIEIDLASMSSTVAYSELYLMLSSPNDYKGKTVCVKGIFDVYESDGKTYFGCIVSDATACCTLAIEFILSGDHIYPEDYPNIGDEIKITGTFDYYYQQIGNSRLCYCQLINAFSDF